MTNGQMLYEHVHPTHILVILVSDPITHKSSNNARNPPTISTLFCLIDTLRRSTETISPAGASSTRGLRTCNSSLSAPSSPS
jgi:hypothetical protein